MCILLYTIVIDFFANKVLDAHPCCGKKVCQQQQPESVAFAMINNAYTAQI